VFNATGTFSSTFGSVGSGPGQFVEPSAVAVDPTHAGNVVVADTNNNRIEIFTDASPVPAPTLGAWGLALCALLLGGLGYRAARRRVT
jgi:tripartite motif-containing protein 71